LTDIVGKNIIFLNKVVGQNAIAFVNFFGKESSLIRTTLFYTLRKYKFPAKKRIRRSWKF